MNANPPTGLPTHSDADWTATDVRIGIRDAEIDGLKRRVAELQIRIRDLEIKIADRDKQITELKAAGDGLGSDMSRPGWQERWARWMRAKGY